MSGKEKAPPPGGCSPTPHPEACPTPSRNPARLVLLHLLEVSRLLALSPSTPSFGWTDIHVHPGQADANRLSAGVTRAPRARQKAAARVLGTRGLRTLRATLAPTPKPRKLPSMLCLCTGDPGLWAASAEGRGAEPTAGHRGEELRQGQPHNTFLFPRRHSENVAFPSYSALIKSPALCTKSSWGLGPPQFQITQGPSAGRRATDRTHPTAR